MSPARQSSTFSQGLSKKQQEETLRRLRELGGQKITEESGIAYHEGKQILLPEGMSLKQAAKLTQAMAISMEEKHDFQKVFRYRPWDGAYALTETLKAIFGIGGQGRAIHSFFGSQPPQYLNIEVDLGKEVKVPWGHIDFPPFEGMFITGVANDPTYGSLFQVVCRAPKKYEPEIEGLWIAIQSYLEQNSIYKGKAMVGVGHTTREGFENPTFLNPYAIDPESVAYKQEVFDRLESSVWGPIRTAELQRQSGLKLNRKTLLFGPYGTGKSLAGGLTARWAVESGWTFIQAKTGDEDLSKVIKTAELYAPAVVFIEDIDNSMSADNDEMAKLLEMFDGVGTKDREVMLLMTSNHADTLSKGMLRGIERLIQFTFAPETLDDDIDFDAIVEAMEGYEPAFIMGTFSLTKSNAVVRSNSTSYLLTTNDFVLAAQTLRNQHDAHINAIDRPTVDQVGQVVGSLIEETVTRVVEGHYVDLENSGELLELQP
jgi:transitional endoplasmic reticulum ATPase